MGARGPKPGQKVGGRTKGTPNKIPRTVKEMVLKALEEEGGVEFLRKAMLAEPAAFMTLLGKIIPQQINANVETQITAIERRIVYAEQKPRLVA